MSAADAVPVDLPFDRAVVDPASVGVDAAALDNLVARAEREIDAGVLPSCQLAVARRGRLVASVTLGDAAPDGRYVVFSCTKGLMAGALWLLVGEGGVAPEQRVVDLVPGFDTHGKDVVTVEHLLTHTGGFPFAPFDPREWDDPDARRARFASWHLAWEPGTRFEYHPTAGHWVLAAVVEAVTGTDFRRLVHERVLDPLGLDRLRLGVPHERQGDVAEIVPTGAPPTDDELREAFGTADVPRSVTDDQLVMLNLPEAKAVGIPGGGAVSTAADLALYYQALLHDPGGLWSPDVLADGTGRVRVTLPDYLGIPANRTLGIVVAGDDGHASLRGFGHTSSPRAFGHNGAGGQVAWADPATGLSFAYLTNGLDAHFLRQWRRSTGLSSRAARLAR